MMNMETPQLLFRRPTERDALIISNLWKDEQVRAFLGGIVLNNAINEKITAIQHHWNQYQFGFFAVVEKNNKEIIGICGPHHSEEENIEISYMFFPQFWGKGFAQESVIVTIDYCFKILNLETLIAITQEANRRSCRLLEKIGMKHTNSFERFDAIQRKYKVLKNEWRGKPVSLLECETSGNN